MQAKSTSQWSAAKLHCPGAIFHESKPDSDYKVSHNSRVLVSALITPDTNNAGIQIRVQYLTLFYLSVYLVTFTIYKIFPLMPTYRIMIINNALSFCLFFPFDIFILSYFYFILLTVQ